MSERTTSERLIRLVDRDAVRTQQCAADLLGVSYQRVQQILNAEGLRIGRGNQRNTLIKWPCPICGKPVAMWTNQRQRKRTAFCRKCAGSQSRPKEYCLNGHLLAETRRLVPSGRYCLLCNRARARAQYQRIKASREATR